ncbi:hypothetical protein HZH68_000933 [Vespula germanica]|uniref:Uncharacterized protein n=1 Tax=Vespula germanica TaxID=30212 RepID=A0A834NUN8_VESGE|nr:hypothetical protein HZH68_000933 [Vespula germanica]
MENHKGRKKKKNQLLGKKRYLVTCPVKRGRNDNGQIDRKQVGGGERRKWRRETEKERKRKEENWAKEKKEQEEEEEEEEVEAE